MKNKRLLLSEVVIYLFILLLFVINVGFTFCEELDGIHVRISHCGEERRFRDVPDDLQFITLFPMDSLLSDTSIVDIEMGSSITSPYIVHIKTKEGQIEKVRLEYYIHTSVSDAEIAIASRFCGRQVGAQNFIDLGREGEIGDNCWYGGSSVIDFVRNNVRLSVRTYDWPYDPDTILEVAKKVDAVIINEEKVKDRALIPAPVIESIDFLSGIPELGKLVKVRVNSIDPKGQSLRFNFSGIPAALRWEYGGILDLCRCREAGQKTFKIWAMNEDRIVSSTEVTFLIASAVAEEGMTAESPQAFILHGNTPNPFNSGTFIGYELARPASVSLRVYDMLGREVTVLDEGMRDCGSYNVFWDGTNKSGVSAASGIYFYRLESGGQAEARRMTLVR